MRLRQGDGTLILTYSWPQPIRPRAGLALYCPFPTLLFGGRCGVCAADVVAVHWVVWCGAAKVSVFKPANSTQSNAETYVVCRGFKDNLSAGYLQRLLDCVDAQGPAPPGNTDGAPGSDGDACLCDMFHASDVPAEFVFAVRKCAAKFSRHMISAIERNMRMEGIVSHADRKRLNQIKARVVNTFIKRTKMRYIPPAARLLGGYVGQGARVCALIGGKLKPTRGSIVRLVRATRTCAPPPY